MKFSEAAGNDYIASPFAIRKTLDIIDINKPKNILEIGLGIGSISYSILEYCQKNQININYFGTEANAYCLEQLPLNLGTMMDKIHLYDTLEAIENEFKFDFVIVDGADDSLEKVKGHITTHGCIFIEGDRGMQVEKLRLLFPNHLYVHSISNFRNPSYGPFPSSIYAGGGKIIYINPTLKQKIHYLVERIKTSLRDRARSREYRKINQSTAV